MSGFPFGIEGRDPDIPSCWHSGTMRRSCCWSIPATIKLTRALVPAVAIDGKLAECCTGRGANVQVLRAMTPSAASVDCGSQLCRQAYRPQRIPD
jgi:hypothetical protein